MSGWSRQSAATVELDFSTHPDTVRSAKAVYQADWCQSWARLPKLVEDSPTPLISKGMNLTRVRELPACQGRARDFHLADDVQLVPRGKVEGAVVKGLLERYSDAREHVRGTDY